MNAAMNYLSTPHNAQNIWKIVKGTKIEFFSTLNMNICGYGMEGLWIVDELSMKNLIRIIEEKLNAQSSQLVHENVTKTIFKTAGEMFIYLIACDSSDYTWMLSIKTFLQTQTISEILININRILTKNQELQKINSREENVVVQLVFGKLFKSLEKRYSLQFGKIKKLMKEGQNSLLATPIEMLSGIKTFM